MLRAVHSFIMKTVATTLILSHLNYCDSLLSSLPVPHLWPLSPINYSAAQLLCSACHLGHLTFSFFPLSFHVLILCSFFSPKIVGSFHLQILYFLFYPSSLLRFTSQFFLHSSASSDSFHQRCLCPFSHRIINHKVSWGIQGHLVQYCLKQ